MTLLKLCLCFPHPVWQQNNPGHVLKYASERIKGFCSTDKEVQNTVEVPHWLRLVSQSPLGTDSAANQDLKRDK